MQSKSISLFFAEAGSDKVYNVQLSPKGEGFVVDFQYGRRGSSLSAGSKTPEPVEYAKALRIYEKLVAEKTGKGYTEVEGGARYQDTANAGRATGLSPQLLNAIEDDELDALLRDDAFIAQEKYDGERRPTIIAAEGITGTNRDGLVVPMSAALESALATVAASPLIDTREGRTVLDGEDLGDAGYVPFDVLEINGRDLRSLPYTERLDILESLIVEASTFIGRAFTYRGTERKRELLRQLREANAEGIVFKRANAPWNPSRPNSGGNALKFKFVATATVVLVAGREGKRSMQMQVVDADGSLRVVGNVTIPVNAPMPSPGTVHEVEYLYRVGDGALFQPVYLKPRNDKATPDTLASLKRKAA